MSNDQKYEMNPSKLLFASILALAISLTVLVSVSIVEQIHAAKYPYKAQLSGQDEVPAVETSARVNVTGITNASAAHIHMGKAGENGKPIVDLLNAPESKGKDTAYGMIFRGNISDSILTGDLQGKTLDDLAAAIESGDTYVNVHTAEHPDGEIRGQLSNTDKEKQSGSSGSSNSTNSSEVGFSTLTE